MNTLDDLRNTLERHADFDDVERAARPMAVRGRVRAARRRRAGAVAAAAATAIVVAAGTTAAVRGHGSPEPADPSLEDVRVPQRIEVDGFPYRLTETARADRDGTITLDEPVDGPAAVALVSTGLGDGQATLLSHTVPVARVRGAEQLSAPTTQPIGELRVQFADASASARAEVAVYTPTGEPARGVSSGGVTFRQRIGDQELVAAAFGRAGGEARAVVADTRGELEVAAYCHSATPDLWLRTDGTTGGFPCTDFDGGNDPGRTNAYSLLRPQPKAHTYAVHVTRRKDGPRAAGVDVTFGFGIYRRAAAPTRVLGAEAMTVMAVDGRTWRLDEVLDAHGGDEFEVDTSEGGVYVGVAYAGVRELSVSWAGAQGGPWAGFPRSAEPQGPSVLYPGIPLLAGDRTVRVRATGSDAQVRLLVYRPL